MAERRLRGLPASRGWAHGPIVVLSSGADAPRVPTGDPALERAALEAAIGRARRETERLAAAATGEAAEMMAFQTAMLEDAELAAPALAAIARGVAADLAWQDAMDAEIAGYEAADDAYFRARSADLQDIRDRVLRHLRPAPDEAAPPPGAVIAASDLPLSRFLAIDWARGGAILLTDGSPSSHVAMLARSRGVPMIVGLGGVPGALAGREALVDAGAGEVVIDPQDESRAAFAGKAEAAAQMDAPAAPSSAPARTADGTRIATHLNIIGPEELRGLDPAICDGIGLYRTEFLFGGGVLPDEETQYAAYRAAVEWAGGRPVTIRTLDAGGDKPIAGLTLDGESNPFLGLRGIRLSLRHHGLFRIQLRALVRAGRHGRLRIMLPMVTVPEELEAARAMLLDEAAGCAMPPPELGIMVEVPAAALGIARFDAAFFSIGSNDLTQYLTAAGRDSAEVAALADPLNPAVLDTIAHVARHGRATGRDVSVCGDAAGEPAAIPALLRAGVRSLSMAASALAACKRAVSGTDLR